MSFTVDMMDVSWPFQMSDIKDAIESKYGLKTAFEVYMHITQKEERFDVLESKKIFVEETQQYIVIDRSVDADITISVFRPDIDIYN